VETLIVSSRYQADPLNLYQRLCHNKANSLLLESAEIDSKDDLKSLLLVDAALKLTCHGQTVSVQALTNNGQALLPLLVKQSQASQVQQASDDS
ncbi:anthranilate synthase component I, partial [Bowmanella dokdonensis]|nr:anthranilate synthase component I [Bowmanella dokdonensis]